MNSMLELVKHRYTAKRYDANKPISDETLNDLLEVLRLSPSSVNIQHSMPFVRPSRISISSVRSMRPSLLFLPSRSTSTMHMSIA